MQDLLSLQKKIQELVDYFRSEYIKHKKESEANTETRLIEPLFDLLGWTPDDYTKRERTHRGKKLGFVDYSFKIGDRVVFYLEAKKVGIPLEKEANKQVISYASSVRIPFAVSTNFEQMNIYCVEQDNALNNVFRVFKDPQQYIENINDLLYLSKEYFLENKTLRKAEDEGRLKKRSSIDRALLDDLMYMRKLISDDIRTKYGDKYDINDRDDIVQRILNRLIFIRRCEDIGISPEETLLTDINKLPDNRAYSKLKDIFKVYNTVYNSGLFVIGKDNDCDSIDIDGTIIKTLVQYLYDSKDKQYVYNFDWIDADVLGQIYEQYLGKILSQTKSGKSKLKDGQAHKKEEGIYYTPTYIVDYILKNTLGELLKDKKVKAKELKILDPACGSGSFLIKAFDYLNKYFSDNEESKQYKLDYQGSYSIKTEILKNNLFGVDLDNKAVEITKLNLLLKAAEKERKLPEELDLHILHRNSLIDDELIAGFNAFLWKDNFQEGSFDVVIGNPPWIQSKFLPENEKEYYSKKYYVAKKQYDLFSLFIEKSLKVLKEGGILGFIVPDRFIVNLDYDIFRKYLLDKACIKKIIVVGEGVFEGVEMPSAIIIIEKCSSEKKRIENKVSIALQLYSKIQIKCQKDFMKNEGYVFNIFESSEASSITKNIEKDTVRLSSLVDNGRGVEIGRKCDAISTSHGDVKFLIGKDIGRYTIKGMHYLKLGQENINYKSPDFYKGEKILIRKTGLGINAVLDKDSYVIQVIYVLKKKPDTNLNLKYILGILNSKLISYYYFCKFGQKERKTFPHLTQGKVLLLPIKIIPEHKQEHIAQLVDKIQELSKQLVMFGNKKTEQQSRLEEEMHRIDNELDQYIFYEVYELSKSDVDIIESNMMKK